MSYIYDKNELAWNNNTHKLEYTTVSHDNFFDINDEMNTYIFPVNHYLVKESNTSKICLNIVPYNFKSENGTIANNSFKFYIVLPFERMFNKLRQIVKNQVENNVKIMTDHINSCLVNNGFGSSKIGAKFDGSGQKPFNLKSEKLWNDYFDSGYGKRLIDFDEIFGLSPYHAPGVSYATEFNISNSLSKYAYYIKLFFLLFTEEEINNMNIKIKYLGGNEGNFTLYEFKYTYENGKYIDFPYGIILG